MALTVTVVDKYGSVLSEEDIKNKTIDKQEYYDIVLPIRKRINDELFDKLHNPKNKCWNFNKGML